MDAAVARHLQAIVADEGEGLARDSQQAGVLLTDLEPDRPDEVSLLVTAAEAGMAAALLDRAAGRPLDDQIAALSQDLAAARGLTPDEAEWAMQAWAFALGTGAPVPAPGRPGRSGGPDRASSARRWPWLLAGAAAVVAIAVAGALLAPQLLGGSDADPDDTAGTPTVAASTPATSAGAPGPLVVLAHQGGKESFPLETLPAVVAAAKSGASPEIDVHWTADGVAVLVHDDETTPASEGDAAHPMICAGGPYTVSKTKWSVLRERCRTLKSASKDGRSYPIPTYDEVIKAIAAVPGAQVFAEVKPVRPTAEEVTEYLSTITKYGMAQRVVSTSFSPDALVAVQAQATKEKLPLRFMRMLRPDDDGALPTPDELGAQGLWGVALRSDIATSANVAGLHAKKLTVVEWTADATDLWNAAKKAQVDHVLTNRPDAYRKWLG